MEGGAPRIVLHVGAPKCGSSAIQAALSARPVQRDGAGRRYAYLCAGHDGARHGPGLALSAARSDYGYESSDNVSADDSAAALFRHAERAAEVLIARDRVPVLSSEGWFRRGPVFARDGLLERLGGRAHVVLFVRPPLDWINAAWWQWGVWTGQTFGEWANRNVSQPRWARWVAEWEAVPGVASVHVRLADRDVVAGFHDLLGLRAPPPSEAVNTTLPPALMAFLLRNRDLRPGPHDSRIEFALLRALRGTRPPQAPRLWALPRGAARVLWDRIGLDAPALARALPPAERARMEADPRWSGPEPYAERVPTELAGFAHPDALAALHDWLANAAGRPAASGPFASTGQADAAIRALVLRLTRPRTRVSALAAQARVAARLLTGAR